MKCVPWTTLERTLLGKMRADGKTIGEISQAIGRPKTAINGAARRYGFAFVPKERPAGEIEMLKSLVEQGLMPKRIGFIMGKTAPAVAYLTRTLGLKRPERWTPERNAEFREMWEYGLSREKIARHFMISTDTVRTRVRALGLPKRQSQLWSDQRELRLKELVELGLTAKEIGSRLGTTKNAVIGKCNRMGLTLKLSPADGSRLRLQRPHKPHKPKPKPHIVKRQPTAREQDLAQHFMRWRLENV